MGACISMKTSNDINQNADATDNTYKYEASLKSHPSGKTPTGRSNTFTLSNNLSTMSVHSNTKSVSNLSISRGSQLFKRASWSKQKMSDGSTVKLNEFDVLGISNDYDPLGRIFDGLHGSSLITNLNIPIEILSVILSYFKYFESTINAPPFPSIISSSPTKNFSESCFLITTPADSNVDYVIHSIETRCGFFESVLKSKWPDDAKVYYQIELFDGQNHIGVNEKEQSHYNVLWKSKATYAGKTAQYVELQNIDLRLTAGKQYLFWTECLEGSYHSMYYRFNPEYKNKKMKKPIYKQLRLDFIREIKLCDGAWFTRNVSKIWHVDFYAIPKSL